MTLRVARKVIENALAVNLVFYVDDSGCVVARPEQASEWAILNNRGFLVDRPTLNRMINRFGADTPLAELFYHPSLRKAVKKEKKNTSKVSNCNNSDGQQHGGDGSSGEVENPPPTPGEKDSKAEKGRSQKKGITTISQKIMNQMRTGRGLYSNLRKRKTGGMSNTPYAFAQEKNLKNPYTDRLMNELEKLVKLEVGDTKESSRLDGKRLIKELVTKRYRLDVYKTELSTKRVLIMVDVSGSCSASASGSLECAMAVYEANKDKVAIVIHTNGTPYSWLGVKSPEEFETRTAFYSQGDWALVINFGDNDAIDLLDDMHKGGANILVLDSYMAGSGQAFLSKKFQQRPNYVWVDGVNTPKAAWVGIKIYLSKRV